MDIFVANEQDLPVDERRVSGLALHTLEEEQVAPDAELSVLFVTVAHIKQLNGRFAGNDYATDVLSFPMMDDEEDEEEDLLGDVVVCPTIAQRNATRVGHSLDAELDVLIVHGILHLLGYDHQSERDKARMDERVASVLSSFDPSRAR